jgi:choice-of-anchor B domain-containing protein
MPNINLLFRLFVVTQLLTTGISAQNYASQNISLLGHFNDPAIVPEPIYGIRYQGVSGWFNSVDSSEYAIIGSAKGTYFINVTTPSNAVQVGFIASRQTDCIWHEIQTYSHYAYIVGDDPGGNSFQIVDLQYLPDSIHVVHDGTTYFERSHTIFIDGSKLWCGSVTLANTGGYYSMAVYDIGTNPEQPVLLRTLNQDYPSVATVHDMFVRNDTAYVSAGYQKLYIYKFNSNNTFTELAAFGSYQESGYNHSSSLTADGRTLIFMDEVPSGLGVKSLDVSNFSNLTINQIFRSNAGCTPHNPYVIGNDVLVCAYYQDGVQIYNIANPSNCVRTGYFDTDTLNGLNNGYPGPAYHGCWGAYTELPSKRLLASDMQNGLYVLDISQAILTSEEESHTTLQNLSTYPNPFEAGFMVNLQLNQAQQIDWQLIDNTGRIVLQGQRNMPTGSGLLELDAENLASGSYTLLVSGETFTGRSFVIKP